MVANIYERPRMALSLTNRDMAQMQKHSITGTKPHELITCSEAMALLNVGRTAFWKIRKSTDFPHPARIGIGRPRFSREAVQAWIAAKSE